MNQITAINAPIRADDPDRNLTLLSLLAQMGAAPLAAEALDALLLTPAGLALSAEDRRYLAGPVIIGKAGTWEEDLPRWLPQQARGTRLDVVLGRLPGHRVAPEEIICAMYASSMVAPMQSQYCDLYAWAFGHSLGRQRGIPAEDAQAMVQVGGARIITDDQVLGAPMLGALYAEMARDIRRRVENHAPKARRKST